MRTGEKSFTTELQYSVICLWNWNMAQIICENEAPFSALYGNVFQHLLYGGVCFLCQRELLLAVSIGHGGE